MVLADYHLDGGVLGLEAVARIRNARQSAIPAILITADRAETTTAAATATFATGGAEMFSIILLVLNNGSRNKSDV